MGQHRKTQSVWIRAVGLFSTMVLLASCGGSAGTAPKADAPASYGSGEESLVETTTTSKGATSAPAPGGTAAAGAAPTTTTKAAAGARPAPTTVTTAGAAAPANPPPTAPPVTSTSDSKLGRGSVGSFARHLLRPEPAAKVVLELLVQDGAALSEPTRQQLVKVLSEASGKPVSTPRVTLPGGGDGRFDAEEVVKLADQYGQAVQGGDQAVIRFLVLKGRATDENALGFAVRGDVLAIFPDQFRKAESPLVNREGLEVTVATHEVGHILGLVDLARKTGREDKDHPGHSSNRGSVMFWAVDSSLVGQVLGGPPPTDFDDADRADLAALRSGA